MEGSRVNKSSICSPIKSLHYSKLEEDKKYILKKLHYLFVFYSAKASRYSYKQINEKCFMELISDTYQSAGKSLYKNSHEWKNIVTLYHGKGKKNSMIYDQFLKLLPAIGGLFSRSNQAQNDLKYLIKHLLLVYDNKVSRQIEQKYIDFDCSIKQNTQDYLVKLTSNLYIVYKIYFPQEINNQFSNWQTPVDEAFDGIITFFKQFQIYPKIINASQLYYIFTEVMQNQGQKLFNLSESQISRKLGLKGITFTFAKFIEVLVHVGRVSVQKLRQIENPEWWIARQKESLKALLQYMESVKTKNKNSRFKQVRFSFIIFEEYSSEGDKLLGMQTEHNIKDTHRSMDFFDMFQRMKL